MAHAGLLQRRATGGRRRRAGRQAPGVRGAQRLSGGQFDVVAFDGDDTLWQNESIFSMTHERFAALMAPYVSASDVPERLFATEMTNLALFGYGVKAFTLSMIETAIELSDGRVTAREIQAIIDAARSMLEHPVELLDGAVDAVTTIGATHRVMLITKGDLFDQESKLARSGLGDLFHAVEIVATKDERSYARILERHGLPSSSFLMVGNSPRSDIAPVLNLGGWAIQVPHPLTWAHERLDDEASLSGHERFRLVPSLADVPAAIGTLEQ